MFNWKKASLPVNPTIKMVAQAPEEVVVAEEIMPQPTEDRNSGKSYEASPDDTPVSAGDIKVAVRVVCAPEVFTGRYF